jgi:hypothetical protein
MSKPPHQVRGVRIDEQAKLLRRFTIEVRWADRPRTGDSPAAPLGRPAATIAAR